MAEFNRCAGQCPRSSLLETYYAQQTLIANPIGLTVLAVTTGLSGLSQAIRARSCPERNQPAETWQPDETCVIAVTQAISENMVKVATLRPHERSMLAPYIKPPTIG